MRFYWIVTLAAFGIIPLSVSGSQTLMAISILWGGWLYLRGRRIFNSGITEASHIRSAESDDRPYAMPFRIGAILFVWLLLVYGIRSAQFYFQSNSPFNPAPWHSEWTDLFLLLFAWIMVSLARRNSIQGQQLSQYATMALLVFATLLVVAGFLSVFSEVRLSKLFTGYGHEFSARNRPQFPYVTIGGLTLYRPIGFMNTRLSYAGLLNFGLLILAGRTLGALPRPIARILGGVDSSESSPNTTSAWKRREWMVWSGLIVLGLLLLWMNGSRSGLLACGLSLSLLFGFALYRGVRRRNAMDRTSSDGSPASSTSRTAHMRGSYGWILFFLFILLLGGATYLYLQMLRTGTYRSTDFMRPIIWKGAIQIFQDHFWIGVGPGNYPDAFDAWRQALALQFPRTMYFLKITPDSHAHNDILHWLAIAGIPGGVLFLALIFVCFRRLGQLCSRFTSTPHLNRSQWMELALMAAFPGFFLAGLSQCYFQDDEVVVVFWVFLAMATILGMAGSERIPPQADASK